KISVIGVGHLGEIHAKLLKRNHFAKLEGVYDIDFQRAEKIALEQSCRVFLNLNDLIESSDAVIISSPTTTHYQIAKKCIENSLHCFIEKPITATYQQAMRLIKLASQKNVIIQVGHVERFNPALKAIMKY
ncbi:MAG: Gfo/Idh/MocA family protein, partial [Candidatus Kapaibacteriota bacterium]